MSRSRAVALATLALGLVVAPGAAQTANVTAADIDRLQVAVEDARAEVASLRARDAALGNTLQAQLEELREEVIYLKVRLRKERVVPRTEYGDLRDRIDDVRVRARRATTSGAPTATTSPTRPAETFRLGQIPVGQELDVRLTGALNSGTAKVEDRVEATTLVDLVQGERVLVPAGSVLKGTVTSVDPATRTDRKGSLALSFDRLTIGGRSYLIRASVVQALESSGIKGEIGRISVGAGVGAIIGGILGGAKGALAGVIIGAGGTIAATEGKDVDLPAGTVLRVRFDESVVVS